MAAVLAAQNVGLNIADMGIGITDMGTGISNMFTNTMNYVINTITSFNFIVFFSLFVSLGKIAYNFVLLILTTIWWVSLVFIPWLIWNPWPPTLFNMGKHDSYIEAAFLPWTKKAAANNTKNNKTMDDKHPIQAIKALGFQWETADPFLFCVHHDFTLSSLL